jgi:prolyl oligopeptidase
MNRTIDGGRPSGCAPTDPTLELAYPPARRSGTVEVLHGIPVADPFDWLDDPTSPETQGWLAAEASLTGQVLEQLPGRGAFRGILSRIHNGPSKELPLWRGAHCFTFGKSQNGGATLVRESAGKPRTVIDPVMFEGMQRLRPEFTFVSGSGRYVATACSNAGSDWLRMSVFDLEVGALLPATWPQTAHLVVEWLPDDSGFIYNSTQSRFGSSAGRDGVYRHQLGSSQSDDVLLFEHEPAARGHAALPILIRSGTMLLIKTLDFVTQRAALHALDLGKNDSPARLLLDDARVNLIGERGDEIFIETDMNAPRGRILALDPVRPVPWRQIAPQRDESLEISAHATRSPLAKVVGKRIFATYIQDAAHHVRMFDESGADLGTCKLPGLFTVQRLDSRGDAAVISITSFGIPSVSYSVDDAGEVTRLTRESALDGESLDIETQQLFCRSDDGTRIPIFVIRPAGTTAPLPTLLYGYGGWRSSLTPSYRPDLAAWIARGGAFAVVNTRGGGEYGEAWHMAGARLNRRKTFEDFCAAGDALISKRICRSDALVARGLSNGGLLVAASMIQRPELFAAVSIAVPLLDVVNLMRLPAGSAIAAELGDPTRDRETFDYIHAYSPLQNVRPSPHRPAVLIAPAERDERVSAAQAFKFTAALQATAQSGQVALLRIVAGEGHVGWSWPVERDLLTDELEFLWAFAAGAREHPRAA